MARSKQQEIIAAQAETIKTLDAQVAALQAQLDALKPKPKAAAPVRYWDEFQTRKHGLRWSRMFRGRVMQRPVQRAES